MSARITRRDFLKLSGAGLAGALLSGIHIDSSYAQGTMDGMQGRVIADSIKVYAEPITTARFVNSFFKDQVIPITETALGIDEKARNRIWYKMGDGYTHSSQVQPVRTLLNKPEPTLRPEGALAEVSVPYTDAYREPRFDSSLAVYRLYFETTYWVDRLVWDGAGNAWYRFYDDKRKVNYFAPATHLRMISDGEIAPISPNVDSNKKWLTVNTTDEIVTAFEDNKSVFMARCSTGLRSYSIFRTTPLGWHITNHKRLSRHMAAGDPASAEGFDLPGIPWVTYFTRSGVSFHGTYWHNDFGVPHSHGCVNLTPQAAKWVLRWSMPAIPPGEQYVLKDYGTSVNVIE
jgi:lipoprotein-anchoring transpeptidase ErfK/SrfK